jgi:hypothetical protein
MNVPRLGLLLLFLALSGLNAAEPQGDGGTPRPPPIPQAASPVDLFRKLLAMSSSEREQALAGRPEPQRTRLQERLAEYEALSPEQREHRRRVTELFWYLEPLMRLSPGQRGERLAQVPEHWRAVIEGRLAAWDELPAADREALLQHQRAIQHFVRLWEQSMPPLPGERIVPAPPAGLELEAELTRLQSLPMEKRQRMHAHWQQFFELPEAQQQRTLHALTESQRREMEVVLREFARLPAGQRRLCVEAFTRFATMPASERQLFLRSAEQWGAFTPAERDAWRRIVTRLPPLPPGFETPRRPLSSVVPPGPRPLLSATDP